MMRLLLSIVVVCALTSLNGFAQQFDWARSGGGTADDAAMSVAIGSDGSVYVAGVFKGSASFGTFVPTKTDSAHSTFDVDVFVTKYSPSGRFVWTVSGGGSGADTIVGIGVDANNVVHIAGNCGSGAQFGSVVLTAAGGRDAFVATITQSALGTPNESAQFANAAIVGGAGDDCVTGFSVASDGNAYFVGRFTGPASINHGTSAPVLLNAFGGNGDVDFILIKFDVQCAPVWELLAGTPQQDLQIGSVCVDAANSRVFFNGATAGALHVGTTTTAVSGGFIAQISTAGVYDTAQSFTSFTGGPMCVRSNGDVYVLNGNQVFIIDGATCVQKGVTQTLAANASALSFNETENAYMVTGELDNSTTPISPAKTFTFGTSLLSVPATTNSQYVAQYSTTGVVQWASIVATQTQLLQTISPSTNPVVAIATSSDVTYAAGMFSGAATIGASTIPTAGLTDAFVTRILAANWITGKVFSDDNGNGVQDGNEAGLPGILIQLGGANAKIFSTASDGSYLIPAPAGTSVINAIPPTYHHVAPTSQSATFTSLSGGLTANKNFAVTADSGHQDLRVSITGGIAPKPGFESVYYINVKNVGTAQIGGFDLQVTFDQTHLGNPERETPTATSVAGNVATWKSLSFDPAESRTFAIYFSVPASAVAGTHVINSATVVTPQTFTDETPSDNLATLDQVIVSSSDPNDKYINPSGNLTPVQVSSSLWLTYTIRFQNTGTAQATNVLVKDTLSQKLIWNSLQTIASSAPCTFEAGGQGGVAWRFTNIDLADSATDATASHGFVTYRIMPQSSLVAGDTIVNWASIYFDYNAPVVTKKVLTIVAQKPVMTRGDSATQTPVTLAIPHIVANAYHVRNLKIPISGITAIDIHLTPPPTVPPVSNNLRIDTTATVWNAPFNHIAAALPANDSIDFTIGLVDSVAYTGTINFMVHHLDGDSVALSFPIAIAGPPRYHDSMTVFNASFGSSHIGGKTFHVRNTKTPSSPISSIVIRMSPAPLNQLIGANLAADGFSLIWNAPFDSIPLGPAARDSVLFDIGLPDSSPWTGTTTLIVHHVDGDTNMLVYGPWTVTFTGVAPASTLPAGFAITSVQPNPVSLEASIDYTINVDARVRLEVMNALGEVVMQIDDREQSAGAHHAIIPVQQLSPGTYWVRMSAHGGAAVVPMMVVK